MKPILKFCYHRFTENGDYETDYTKHQAENQATKTITEIK